MNMAGGTAQIAIRIARPSDLEPNRPSRPEIEKSFYTI